MPDRATVLSTALRTSTCGRSRVMSPGRVGEGSQAFIWSMSVRLDQCVHRLRTPTAKNAAAVWSHELVDCQMMDAQAHTEVARGSPSQIGSGADILLDSMTYCPRHGPAETLDVQRRDVLASRLAAISTHASKNVRCLLIVEPSRSSETRLGPNLPFPTHASSTRPDDVRNAHRHGAHAGTPSSQVSAADPLRVLYAFDQVGAQPFRSDPPAAKDDQTQEKMTDS